jgi:hypothetical protein
MTYVTESVVSRIAWCQQQKTLSRVQPDREGWSAEEAGLRDALLNRDHTNHYRACPTDVFDRYVLGLQDGLALMRAAAVAQYYALSRD